MTSLERKSKIRVFTLCHLHVICIWAAPREKESSRQCEGLDQAAHMRSLIRALAVRLQTF